MTYIKKFIFASKIEEIKFIEESRQAKKMTYFNSLYPFQIFPEKSLHQFDFDTPITILYGGNGSSIWTDLQDFLMQ